MPEEVKKLIPYDRIMITTIDEKHQVITTDYVSGHDVPDRRKGDHIPFAGSITEAMVYRRSGILMKVTNKEECVNFFRPWRT